MASTGCDLCQQQNYETIAETDRDGQPLQTVICRTCGLVQHAHIPSEEELQQFYESDYRNAYHGEKSPCARRIMRAWKNGSRICQQVAPLLDPAGRVLEIGAGIGCTVKVFEQHGFSAEGIDPGGEFLRFSKENLDADVTVTNLYDLPARETYEAILLVHVVEHLRSPRQAFDHIASLLKPGGMFYVECPNLQAPFARRNKLFHVAHIYNFVPETLTMLAERCGFRFRKRFGDDQDPNLQMLFQYTGDRKQTTDPENYARTMAGLEKSNSLPYHLRRRYVVDRIRKVSSYAHEYFLAHKFVDQLIQQCQTESVRNQSRQQRAA